MSSPKGQCIVTCKGNALTRSTLAHMHHPWLERHPVFKSVLSTIYEIGLTWRKISVSAVSFPSPSRRCWAWTRKCIIAAEPMDKDATTGPRPRSLSLWNWEDFSLESPELHGLTTYSHLLAFHVCCAKDFVELGFCSQNSLGTDLNQF